jgi:ubiquitin carboxyl-terminal hydrolase L5
MGVPGVQVEEVYGMDHLPDPVKCPIYGMIFLFKWKADLQPRQTVETENGLFFANQVVQNACATQAILSILLNQDGKIKLGQELEAFQEFTASMPPEVKGLAIGNSDIIRNVHNSFARPEPFVMEDKQATSDGEAFHFISYVPYRDVLYELDGLQKGPIDLGPCTKEDWLEKAKAEMQKRIEQGGSEIRFNLMTVGKSLQEVYTASLSDCNTKKEELQAKATAGGDEGATAQAHLMQLEEEIASLHAKLADENEKRKNYKIENIRRKHNYIPFVLKFLKILAEKGQLNGLVEKAKQKK